MADLPRPVETTVHIADDKDRKIRDYATPGADQFASGIPRPDANNRFELKPVMFQMLQTMGQFGGSTVEDPHAHIKSFLEVADISVRVDMNTTPGTSPKRSSPTRRFNKKMRIQCWEKADVVPGRDPDRWRRDLVGNPVCRKLNGCEGPACFEYDHIIPYSAFLQQRINRFKSNKQNLSLKVLSDASCNYKLNDYDFDIVERAVYGNVTDSAGKIKPNKIFGTRVFKVVTKVVLSTLRAFRKAP
ncbi:hypothetical protein OSB04_017700 [Centaurea solstitialis]|uniref:Uncharacterized protein n=1 Tax=Centaurea solstitialis TaxID=347529 RepID=A0AA38WIL6_9ASTR|nr:hypothetical protein OSB04_017700 [Centaurea solstitialis]